MKNIFITISLSFFLFSFSLKSQEEILLKYPIGRSAPMIDSPFLEVGAAWQWRKDLMIGVLDSTANRSTQKFRIPFNEGQEQAVLVYPVALVYNQVMNQAGVNEIISDTTFFCNLSQSQKSGSQVSFKLPEGGEWANIDIDSLFIGIAGDPGWKKMLVNEEIIFYSQEDQEDTLFFRLYSQQRVLEFRTILKGLQCQSIFPSPQLPPWPMLNTDLPWQVAVDTEWGLMSGNAYTLLSEDGLFDRPFIFVEGIDFGSVHGYHQNGTFGWCQFSGGDYSGNYAMMNESPVFLSELRTLGYDIILLDFYDGAADIRANAEVLIELISLCNQYKTGDHLLTVAGASMGGQVARCALGKMEQQQESHCVGAYISLDSPHTGANIPLGLQAALSYLSTYNVNAEDFIQEALNRTASQQLLIYQWLDSEGDVQHPWKRAEYENYLMSIPFPSQCYSMAISNGNFQNQPLPCGPFLIEENCDASIFLPGNELEIRAFTLPGDMTNPSNTDTETVIADMTYTTYGWNGIIPDVTQDHQLLKVPIGLLAMDCAPGGYRTSVEQLVSTLNDSEMFTNECGTISSSQYLPQHCFVPSASAWGVDMSFSDLSSAWLTTPFDAVYSPYGQNEPHSALTAGNSEWVLNQLSMLQSDITPINVSPSGSYNFGGNEDFVFPLLDIHGNQKISIQKQAPLHGSLPPPAIGSHQEMVALASCGDGDIVLHDKAVLEIGDMDGISTASLVIRSGVTLDVFDKGTCWIFPGSRLIIENGGRVRLHGQGGLRNVNGFIEIREGGELIYETGYCSLEKEQSKLLMYGGLVHVLPGGHLNWTPNESESGSIWVFQNEFPEFYLETGAEMYIHGQGLQDTVLFLRKGAHCDDVSYLDNHIKIRLGQVVLEAEAVFSATADVTLHDVWFNATPGFGESNFNTFKNRIDAYNARFENIGWHSTSHRVQLFDVKSEGVSNWDFSHGRLYYLNGEVIGHGMFFTEMLGTTQVSNVVFTGEGNSLALSHIGTDTLMLEECQISDFEGGILKQQGLLYLGCSELSQLVTGIRLLAGAQGVLNDNWGRNEFVNNDLHILVQESPAPYLQNGRNFFSWATGGPYVGGSCSSSNTVINWGGNFWQTASFSGNFQLWNLANSVMSNIQIEPQMDFTECTMDETWALKSRNVPKLALYPNPVKVGQLVCVQNAGLLDILDAGGRSVLSAFTIQASETTIELTARLSPGCYYVRFEQGVTPLVILP
jgi:hypothetical protein